MLREHLAVELKRWSSRRNYDQVIFSNFFSGIGIPITQRDQRWVAPADCWNWGKWVQMKGPFLGWLVGLVVPVPEILYPALAALVSPIQNIFFLTPHFSTLCIPVAQQPGQAVGTGCLSLYMCLLAYLSLFFAQSKKLSKSMFFF
jgi:hypothetical protein